MTELQLKVVDPNGMHARPAGLLVKALSACPGQVTLSLRERQADGRRLFSVMALGAKLGDVLQVKIAGDADAQAETEQALRAFCGEGSAFSLM